MSAVQKSDREIASPIRCILSDVDGVMTDGKIIYDSSGAESKQFHVRDGLGIKRWMLAGFEFGIVTARSSDVVRRRAEELGVPHIYQNAQNKLACVQEIAATIGCDPNQLCYIGDDLPDLGPMRWVGLAVAPADAARDVRETAHWTLRSAGGEGTLRELIERLMRATRRWNPEV